LPMGLPRELSHTPPRRQPHAWTFTLASGAPLLPLRSCWWVPPARGDR
jgi:hypothetical protein